MYKAKILKLDQLNENKIILEINSIEITAFTSLCPYPIYAGESYNINLYLNFLDDPNIEQNNEPKYGLEKINNGFKYNLFGKINGQNLIISNGIEIEDDIFHDYQYLNNQFIKMKVDRLEVEFI